MAHIALPPYIAFRHLNFLHEYLGQAISQFHNGSHGKYRGNPVTKKIDHKCLPNYQAIPISESTYWSASQNKVCSPSL